VGQLIVQQFVTADGFAADVDGEFTIFDGLEGDDAEFNRRNAEWARSLDAILLGARTYEMFVSYWPTPASADEPIAPMINTSPKFVVSRTLESAPWGDYEPATVEHGDPVDTAQRLKRDLDGDIVLWGSLDLARQLFSANEVDLVRLVYLPVAIGAGYSTFPAEPVRLRPLACEQIHPFTAMDFEVVR
jgi:dihydrofolate reductase